MDGLEKEKRNAESKLSRLNERVMILQWKHLEEEDKLHSSTGAAQTVQEIASLEATERWLKGKADLAETTIELANIELAISRAEKTAESGSAAILKFEVRLARAESVHASENVQVARTAVRLSEVRIKHARNEGEKERCEKSFEHASRVLECAIDHHKNAIDHHKNANENLRIALKELDLSTTGLDASEGGRSSR
jgi:hypothetical protein